MNEYLKLKKSNCKNCYKCIRSCPVKSIKFSDNQAHIVGDECILCGECFVVCPQNAKEIRNDVQTVKKLIASGTRVIASVAPSFTANYSGSTITGMRNTLKKLGFFDAFETASGAADVKNAYDKMIEEEKQDVIISTCCHSINLLIQKHYPEAIKYLAPVISPMHAHCLAIKNKYPDAKTVFIGPCISKKAEADLYSDAVDCAITFEELTEWLYDEKLTVDSTPDPEDINAGKARMFPTTGGILKTMKCSSEKYQYLAIDGVMNCISAIKDIINGNISNCFIEMSACVGSCIGGPAMDEDNRAPVRDYIAVDKYSLDGDFKLDFHAAETTPKEFSFIGARRQMPGSSAIAEILKKMGKTSPKQELNCGSCGYNTCREKAIAVINGKADLTMCLPFLKEKAESFSDNIIQNTPNGIIVLNENLEVQQINKAACNMINIQNASDILGDQVVRILDPQPFFEVVQTGRNIHDKRIYLAEYDCYIEETVIYDKEYHIVMCMMRDVTDEERQRIKRENISKQTIETTDKVIEKQMRIVQEIASLLGETTAETKIALTKLRESLKND